MGYNDQFPQSLNGCRLYYVFDQYYQFLTNSGVGVRLYLMYLMISGGKVFINLTSSKGENTDGHATYDDYFYNALKCRIDPKICHLPFNTIGRNSKTLNHFFSSLPLCPHGAKNDRVRLHPNLYEIIILHGWNFF